MMCIDRQSLLLLSPGQAGGGGSGLGAGSGKGEKGRQGSSLNRGSKLERQWQVGLCPL